MSLLNGCITHSTTPRHRKTTRLTNNADDGRKMMKLVVCSTRVSQIYGVREAEHQRVAQVSINCYKNLKLNVESKSA